MNSSHVLHHVAAHLASKLQLHLKPVVLVPKSSSGLEISKCSERDSNCEIFEGKVLPLKHLIYCGRTIVTRVTVPIISIC